MAKKPPPTPLRRWLALRQMSISTLARTLKVSRARAQFWVAGKSCPRGHLLDALMTITGLTVRELTPRRAFQDMRMRQERLRRARVAVALREQIRAEQAGSPHE